MKIQSAAFLDQADVMLTRAERMLSVGLNEEAARAAYLACFHVAQAYIFERTGSASKTHRGVQTEFFRLSRDEARADHALRRFLSGSYEFKSVADYGVGPDAVISAQEAAGAITTAKRFVGHFRSLIAIPNRGDIATREATSMPAPIVIADSITRVGPEAAGAVVVNASHGGVYAAYLAAKLHAAAAIFNDAGVGRDRAGIGGLDYLEEFGIAAATVGHDTRADRRRRRHDGAAASSPMRTGSAASLGVSPGQSCRDAAAALQQAHQAHRAPPEALEAAFLLIAETPQVWALNSASLVLPEHKDSIVITGSHGGLLGGRPETALKYDVLGALYNDAGIGKDEAGISRLPALDARGIAAATVSAASARIGDARSTYEDGIISRVNARAAALGLREGISAREFVAGLRRALAA